MRSSATWLVAGLVLVLAGCSITQPAAPVREWRRPAKRVPKPPPVLPDTYLVQPGDTLFRIAFEHGLEYRLLADWNDLTDPSRIKVGERLRLKAPASMKPEVRPQTSPPAPAPAPAIVVTTPAAESAPAARKVSLAPPGESGDTTPDDWTWPAKGEVLSRFGASPGANGVDIGGARGSPVFAAAAGRVVYVGAGLRGYGKLIIIKHSGALLTAYGHNDRVLVSEGQMVKLGERIADMGDSDSDRVKLHFEIREYGKPVDPMGYLPG